MIAGLAGAMSLVGTVSGVIGSFMQYSASMKAEKARERQMELEARRARREQVRQAQVHSATAVAAATNQGAGATSALSGGIAQVRGAADRNIQAVNQDEQLSHKVFAANRQYAFGGMISSLGAGISNLGGAFTTNSEELTRRYNGFA